MRKIMLFLSTLACLATEAQQLNQSVCGYRAGDELEKIEYSFSPNLLNDGTVWSMEELAPIGKPFTSTLTQQNDSLVRIERGQRIYYQDVVNSTFIVSEEDAYSIVGYDMPESWLRFPITQGDSIGGYFHGTGKYCDQMFLRRYGTYNTKADGFGSLVLPEGDTLRHVLRLHTVRQVCTQSLPIDTLHRDVPSFTVDSIVHNLKENPTIVNQDVYRWYAQGFRYPVLEVVSQRNTAGQCSHAVFYSTVQSQEQLPLDEANIDIRRGAESTEGSRQQRHANSDRAYFGENARAVLTDSRGYIYRQSSDIRPAGRDYDAGFDTSGLRSGQYILRIETDKQVYTKKINIK